MGLVLSLFVIFHNGNPYKRISLNSPDFIKVIIDLYPAVFVVTLAGGELFPVTTGLSEKDHTVRKCILLPKITMARIPPAEPMKPKAGGLRPRDLSDSSAKPGAVSPWEHSCPAPTWLLPQHRGDFHPWGKKQVEMSLECKMLWEQAAIYESAVAWMWLLH